MLVIDADGLNVVCKDVNCIRGYTQAILTPNVVEFGRLWKAVIGEEGINEANWTGRSVVNVENLSSEDPNSEAVSRLSRELGGCTIFLKVAST